MTLFYNHLIINILDCFVPRNDERLKTSFPAVWRHAIPIRNDVENKYIVIASLRSNPEINDKLNISHH